MADPTPANQTAQDPTLLAQSPPVPSSTSQVTVTGIPAPTTLMTGDPRETGQFQGVQWGDFIIGAMLGRGGMGTVYHGQQLSLERPVAIKVLPAHVSHDEVFRSRFLREAKAVAAISSPHVVQVIHAGSHLGHEFYVMELVQGSDLAQRLRRGWRPTRDEAVGLVIQAARGLAAAARHRIVHRDIKPANMLLGSDGVLKLTDFGLARTGNDHIQLTTAGTVMGTASYLSPEQARGLNSDHRSDLYALGAVFYELLTGTPPFVADDPQGVIYQHINDPPPDPRDHAAGIDAGCTAVIHRLMAKDPGDRYQSAEDLLADLDRLQRHERPLTALVRRRRPGTRTVMVAAVVACMLAALVAWRLLQPAAAAPALPGTPPPAGGQPATPPPATPLPGETTPAPVRPPVATPPEPPKPVTPAQPPITTSPPTTVPPSAPTPPRRPVAPETPPATPVSRPIIATPPRAPIERLLRRDEHGRYVQVVLAGNPYRFRECPTGTFAMGSPEEEDDRQRDESQHLVSLASFWISDTEVTQAQWSSLMGSNPSRFPGADRPVEQISRPEAQEFLRKLGETTPGLAPRLPTEPEWEYACRAGSTTPFANGRPLATIGWYTGNSGGQTHTVRSFPPNAWGIFDMHGNVAEWTADGYQPYPNGNVIAPTPILEGKPVIRGGSYKDDPEDCRGARRDYSSRKSTETIGFRFVINALPPAWETP